MEPSVRNLLYRHPELYERVYPEPGEETPRMCQKMFQRFMPEPPQSVLDMGCGTGRDLASLAKSIPDCWGIDFLEEMIGYATSVRPSLKLQAGDMRTVRLGRCFDAIICMGSALMYALTNQDLSATFKTFATHAHSGTLLILDLNNAASYLGDGGLRPSFETTVSTEGFTARATATHTLDRRRQLLVRKRVWHLQGAEPVEDFCRYRMLFPAELDHWLAAYGFRVLEMFDNKDLRPTDLTGARLYVAGVFASQPISAVGLRVEF